MLKNFIKNYFKSIKFCTSSYTSFLKKNQNIKIKLQKILNRIPQYLTVFHIIEYVLEDKKLIKCKNCGKYLTVAQINGLNKKGGYGYCKECNKLPEIRKKIRLNALPKFKKTMMERYGVEFTARSKELNKKREITCLKKYGTKSAISSEIVKKKICSTLKDKYGVNNIAKLNKIKSLNEFKQYLEPLFSQQEYLDDTNFQKHIYKWKCKKCGNIFQDYIHKTMHIQTIPYLPRCLKCYPYLVGKSNEELQIIEFLKRENLQIKEHNREIISPYELDLVIPKKKIAIEFNGSYFHSINKNSNNYNYHLNKTILCEKAGYKLIHIWQYDWLNKTQLIKEKLKAILDIDQAKIYARKCIIKEISTKNKNDFLNTYHIQGEDKSNIKLGLYFENELVAVMTFGKPRFNKKYEYELIRYATKAGYRVLGGAGKLLKYFQKTYHPKSLITYADRSYSQGNMYIKIGFIQLKPSIPNYIYTNNKIILTRYQCQKHKLKKLLGDKFDPNLTQTENMIANRFYKIYDCGNLVFEKIYKN